VREIVEKPVYKHLISAGIYVISPEVIASIETGQALDMPDLLQGLIDQGQPVHVFPIFEYWLDIGRPEDFARAAREFPESMS
jgi:NDP-sugar pyrophosphorylase family protein